MIFLEKKVKKNRFLVVLKTCLSSPENATFAQNSVICAKF